MDIKCPCTKCRQHLAVDETGAGQIVQCPKCNESLIIPSLDVEAPPADELKIDSPAVTTANRGSVRRCAAFVGVFFGVGLLYAAVIYFARDDQPGTATAPDSKATHVQSVEEKATVEFWHTMTTVESKANATLKSMQLGQYPRTENGGFDYQNFSNQDFETFRDFHLRKSDVKNQVAKDIGGLNKLNVDGDLLQYMSELCSHWESSSNVSSGWAKLVSALYAQRIQFTSGSAYAFRFLKAFAGQNDMERRYQENQNVIDQMAADSRAEEAAYQKTKTKIDQREREIKILLTQRYKCEFN